MTRRAIIRMLTLASLISCFATSTSPAIAAPAESSATKPEVTITRPQADELFWTGKPKKVHGYLKPQHTEGTYPVRLYLYRKSGDAWVEMDSVRAKVTDYEGYSKYSANVEFPRTGRWRVKAVAIEDDEHAETWSDPDDLWVKTVWVRPPSIAKWAYVDKSELIWGYIKPYHTSGTKPVEIHRWKRVGQHLDAGGRVVTDWKYYGHKDATVSGYHWYSKYSTKWDFPSTGYWRIRAYHPEDATHDQRWSWAWYGGFDYLYVLDVRVETPNVPDSVAEDKSVSVYGYLKPHHEEDTHPVRIYKWKKTSDGWKSYGYVSARVYDYDTYSRYRRSISFPSPGKWRIRAYHPECDTERARWSEDYSYVTVTD